MSSILLSLSIPTEIRDRLDARAALESRTRSNMARVILAQALGETPVDESGEVEPHVW
jgi:hypothetical protein